MDRSVLWMALSVRRERGCGSGSRAGGAQQVVLPQDGDGPETGSGELRACRHFDQAG